MKKSKCKDNSYFQRIEEFMYLRTTITDQNFIQEEINTLRTGDADLRFLTR